MVTEEGRPPHHTHTHIHTPHPTAHTHKYTHAHSYRQRLRGKGDVSERPWRTGGGGLRTEKKSNHQQHGFDIVRIHPPCVPPMSHPNPSPPNFFELLLPRRSEHCAAGAKSDQSDRPFGLARAHALAPPMKLGAFGGLLGSLIRLPRVFSSYAKACEEWGERER